MRAAVMAAVTAVALTVSFTVSGCSAASAPRTSADCAAQVRAEGHVYTSHGCTDQRASRYAVADAADCQDVGEDAPGSVFGDPPRQVGTWSFRGYPTDEVVGVRSDQDSWAVFVADSVPPAKGERIVRELAPATP